MITFTATGTADSSNLILPITNVATPRAVTATYLTNVITSDVLLEPVPQVTINPDVTTGLACAVGDDRDNDAICDSWETSSGLVIPYNGVTFAVPSAGTCHALYDGADPLNANLCPDPTKPDVYVQVSWMDGHRPDQNSLINVVNSYRNAPVTSPLGATGINLHILVDTTSMPIISSILLDGTVTNEIGFRQLKSQYFMTASDIALAPSAQADVATAKRQVFHYAAFVHDLSEAPGSSGWGEILGNDFIVSLGTFTGQVGSTNHHAGTFMHELGHNLNLNHGGPGTSSVNCKPPYLSVMNYLYQFNSANGGFMAGRPLDYSHSRIYYDESLLDEQAGIPASDPAGLSAVIARTDPSTGAITVKTVTTGLVADGVTSWADFNQNGIRETGTYAQNTHNFGIPDCTDTSVRGVGGFDDWHSLNFNFKTSSLFSNGVTMSTSNAVTNPALDDGFQHEITESTVAEVLAITAIPPDPPVNTAPVITSMSGPVDPILLGTVITTSATFTDVDVGDTHTAVWNWGDGTTTTLSAITDSTHSYTASGVYTITLTINDNNGGSASQSFQFAVVYDPSGGFVTGGGWITSPAGAYTTDTSLSGKATFGFVSKYLNGANVPTGDTKFQFKAASFDFKSKDYQWLVISGAKAQYKGTGTINGAGDYGFMLTSVDGDVSGGGGIDKLRLKVWTINTDSSVGGIIYDNNIGASDTTDPSTALGGGSITIHK